jgi:hypothetical protein
MTPEELKALTTALQELSLSSKETANAIHGFSNELRYTQRLWRKSGNSKLIKIGLALIAFPDPTISDVIGCALVAAGIVQLKMKHSALHVEDVYKTFPQVVKELTATRLNAP